MSTGLDAEQPLLSVVIATPDTYSTIRRTIEHLRAQTLSRSLEIIIVTPSHQELGVGETDLRDFQRVDIVEIGALRSVGSANAAGVRRATAPIIAFAETHAFPAPGWAAALVRAHCGPWAAVGPVMVNANPSSVISWADFLIAYGRWPESSLRGVIDDLPGHNSSYKRDVLREYDADLEMLLETETVLHCALRASGQKLFLEPAAQTAHVNPTLFRSYLLELYTYARLFAVSRGAEWSWSRRLAFLAGSPLIVAIRLLRLMRQLNAVKPLPMPAWRILPVAALGLLAATAGEVMGAQFGPADAAKRLCDFEFHRERHLTRSDRRCLGL